MALIKVGNIRGDQAQPKPSGMVKVGNIKTGVIKPKRPLGQENPNYIAAKARADASIQEANKANSFAGMARNAIKAAPRAALNTLVGNPIKLGLSALEVPEIVKNRAYTNREYNVPGLGKMKSFQSDYGQVANDVIEGKKGLGSAAWSLAQIPLAGLETGGIASGLKTAYKAKSGVDAAKDVMDAFLPTFRSKKTVGVAPKVAARPLMRSGTPKQPLSVVPPTSGQTANQIVSKVDSYTGNLPRKTGKVNTAQVQKIDEIIDAEVETMRDIKNSGEVMLIDSVPWETTPGSPSKYRASSNPQWYSDFYKEYGRKPGKAETRQLAEKALKNGSGYFSKEYQEALSGTMPLNATPDVASISQKLEGVEGGKQRGFIGSLKNTDEVSQDLASRVQGTYEPTTNKAGLEKAQRTIFDNITEAERIAKNDVGAEGGLMNNELIKHYDSIAQQAKQSGDTETFNRAMDKAVEIAESRARNLTETAQNLQAASTISKLSPEGLLHYINKVSRDIDAPTRMSNDDTFDFMRRAGEIQRVIDPREKAFKTFDLIDDLAEKMPRGKKDKFLEALNLPRAIMSTGDLSAPLRQGIFTAARHPITFGKNFAKMFKYAFSEDAYRGLKADIITSPNYNLYVKHKLPLTDVSAGLTGREEAFMSNMAEKIPVFGKLAKGSNRAYTGFLNKMRVDLFDDFVKTAELNGIKDQKYFDDAAKFVGAATGRGNLFKTLEGSAPALNSIFFSPRLMASRISLINPAFYMKLEPAVRKEALKSLGAFVGTGMSILALAKANGAEVGTDPRSADFGKIKYGNTRYDIWGGFQQYARLIGQLSTGEKISTITGKETTLGQGYNAPTRKSILGDFFQSKTAPIASLLLRGSEGEKYGEKFNLPAEVLDRFLPMVSSDAFDLYREYGAKGVAGAVPGFFGVGSQTYGDQVPTIGTTEANNPTIKWRTQPGLGETILNKMSGEEVSTIPKDQWKALYEERKQEQIRQAEVDKVKQMVLITGEPQYVGDTKVYLENGVVKTKKESKEKRLPMKDQILFQEIQKRGQTNPYFTP